jgi:16S rRNA pseudouridine516 synthase
MGNTVRLDKLLANAGYGSRKEIKALVKAGAVAVNGNPLKDGSLHINTDADKVSVNGNQVLYREFVYLMLNKPAGCISATVDDKEPTVMQFVPPEYRHYDLFPVGRLDKDTEGLLLLTNDGKLAHELLAPKKHVPKTYFVRVDGKVNEEHKTAFSEGAVLDDGYKTRPAELKILTSSEVSEVEVTIHEGKFHQVKRMFKAIGMNVLYLQRIMFGSLVLDPTIKKGQIRELNMEEIFNSDRNILIKK